MVYPGSGIPNSTGSAWGTSYGVTGTGSVVLSASPTLTGTITGAAATLSGALSVAGATSLTNTLLTSKTSTNLSEYAETISHTQTSTASGTYYNIGKEINLSSITNTGVTNSGYSMGLDIGLLRNNVADIGTLDSLIGQRIQFGHYTPTSTARTTNNAFGLDIQPFYMNGTITNLYGIYIGGGYSGGTATNKYDLYAADSTFNNYFAGKVGIGTLPTYQLHVSGSDASAVVYGTNSSTGAGVYGANSSTGAGVYGYSSSGTGVAGTTAAGGSTYYGGYFTSGSYSAGIARADGYSMVGTGILYNVGMVQSTSGGFKFPDNTIQTTAASGGGGSNYTCTKLIGSTATFTPSAATLIGYTLIGGGGGAGSAGSGTAGSTAVGSFSASGGVVTVYVGGGGGQGTAYAYGGGGGSGYFGGGGGGTSGGGGGGGVLPFLTLAH